MKSKKINHRSPFNRSFNQPGRRFYRSNQSNQFSDMELIDDWSTDLTSSRKGWRSEIRRYLRDIGGSGYDS